MKFILKYPKLIAFFFSILLAYVLFDQGAFHWIEEHLDGESYVTMFIAGYLFSFGFTAPLSAAYFFETGHLVTPLLAAPLAAAGAVLSDMSIFHFTRLSFHDEILLLKETPFFRRIHNIFHHESISDRLRTFLRWVLACIVIASPFPDEIGMTLVLGFTHLRGWKLSLLCFTLNTLGIYTIMEVGILAAR